MFRTRREQQKNQPPRPTAKPTLESVEERILLSVANMNPLASVVVASPPAAPSVAALVSYVESTMNRMMTAAQQEVSSLVAIIAQEEAFVIQQVDHLFGIAAPSNSTLSTAVQQTSSGSDSGSGAMPIHPTVPTQGDPKLRPPTSGSGIHFDTGPDYGGGGTATVTGQVWLDSNGDGFKNNGEMGFSEIQVYLVNAGGYPVAGDITDDNGDYQMTINAGPVPANYNVHVVFPPYDLATSQNGDSQIDQNGNSAVFALAAGDAKAIEAGIRSMNVTLLQDHPPGQPIQDQTTLRDAIQTGNNGPPQPAVTFIDPATKQNLNGTISLQSALDPIKKSYNIVGSGFNLLQVQGNGNANNPYRIFTINGGVTSTISGLTILGGYAQNDNGGGILNDGNLTLLSDDITFNTAAGAENGGGIYNASGAQLQIQSDIIHQNTAAAGGGLYNNYGTVIIGSGSVNQTNTVFQYNTASLGGGGIFNHGGTITVNDNTQIVQNKDTSSSGGGVANVLGTFFMDGGSISNNTELVGGGGGVTNMGTMTLSGLAIQGNQAITQGGGLYVSGGKLTLRGGVTIGGNQNANANKAGRGGGVFINGGAVTISGGAIGGNVATSISGGGIFINSGKLTLNGAAVNGNKATFSGGGMEIEGGTVKVTGGSINTNQSLAGSGGGIYVNAGSLTMTGNYFLKGNKAPNDNGGGMILWGGKVTLSGGSITGNNSGSSGGGIYNESGSLTIQKNVQIISNSATNQGGGLYLELGSTTTFVGNVLAGNPACTISGDTAKTGNGVYQQVVGGKPATINNWAGVIDKCDNMGQPFQGP